MENRKPLVLLLAASVGIVLGSLYLFRVQSLRDQVERAGEKVPVVVAARPLGIGETLDADALRVQEWPKGALPSRAVLGVDADLLAGRSTIHPLPAGEPIMWTDLPEGPRLSFPTEHIPKGLRAIALPADEISTLSHILRGGDRVDVLVTSPAESGGRLRTALLAEGIQVFSSSSSVSSEEAGSIAEGDGSSITLLVQPDLALALCQALRTGDVSLLARSRKEASAGPSREAGSTPPGGQEDPR